MTQGDCGGCWAFAATETLSDNLCITSNGAINVTLSAQDAISCDSSDWGCNGGQPKNVWKFLSDTGVSTNDCTPYVSGPGKTNGTCSSTCSSNSMPYKKYKCEHSNFYRGFDTIKQGITQYGSVHTVMLVWQDLIQYKKGVYKHLEGNLMGPHSVKIIGWGKDKDVDYWIVQNSWGASWGMDGFFNIDMNDFGSSTGRGGAWNCGGSAAEATQLSVKESKWREFVDEFERKFETKAEETLRRQIFYSNLERIQSKQEANDGAQYSFLTPFADWSKEEFQGMGLSAKARPAVATHQLPLLDTSALPESFDWREKGAVNTPVNQGKCGDCWAFSTIANIEGVNFVSGSKKLVKLSEQQLTDCSTATGNEGCQDGYPSDAFRDMVQNKYGLMSETDYPFTSLMGKSGACQAVPAKESVFIKGWTNISSDEDQIAAALVKYGVLSMAINAGVDGMEFYKSGISTPKEFECPAARINHAVNMVGFGVEDGKKYWVVRNSYGPKWGEEGYYRIARGACGVPNKNYQCCGLNTMVTTALMDPSESIIV